MKNNIRNEFFEFFKLNDESMVVAFGELSDYDTSCSDESLYNCDFISKINIYKILNWCDDNTDKLFSMSRNNLLFELNNNNYDTDEISFHKIAEISDIYCIEKFTVEFTHSGVIWEGDQFGFNMNLVMAIHMKMFFYHYNRLDDYIFNHIPCFDYIDKNGDLIKCRSEELDNILKINKQLIEESKYK